MWIICLVGNSHEMPSLTFSERYKMKIKILSTAVVISSLRVKWKLNCAYSKLTPLQSSTCVPLLKHFGKNIDFYQINIYITLKLLSFVQQYYVLIVSIRQFQTCYNLQLTLHLQLTTFYYFFIPYFYYILERIKLDISCELSAKQMIHINCQVLFLLKKKLENRMSSAALVISISRVKQNCFCLSQTCFGFIYRNNPETVRPERTV